eukprot:TRINITY_DN46187_c0_g1_i1.p2 TRINITY_DN46187_c0_g1~~TRINITY_DN46187_c0_g1_i1.p2  ORF type:complete len:148 (+),score=17.88 TRINITY_DN46187_c0_g1_i1:3-446(+)
MGLDMIPKDGTPWWLMGASYGSRVAVAIASEGMAPTPMGLILTGFPMYGPKGTRERVDALGGLPSSVRMLCISGEADEFIGKNVPAGELRGAELWGKVLESCDAAGCVRIVDKGGHGCFPTAKGGKQATCDQIVQWTSEWTADITQT